MSKPQALERKAQEIRDMIAGKQNPSANPAPEAPEASDDAASNEAQETAQQAAAPPAATPAKPSQAATPPQAGDSVEALRKDLAAAEQRWRTLQGMIDSREKHIERLEQLLERVNGEPQPPAASAEPAPDEVRDRKDFGDDYIDMVKRYIAAAVKPIEARLNALAQSVESTDVAVEQTRKEKFNAAMSQRVPKWLEIDTRPHFIEWFNSSRARVAMGKQAMANYDHDALAELFEQYLVLHPEPAEQPAQPARPKPAIAPRSGRASTTANEQAPEKRTWKRSEIAQAFQNRRQYTTQQWDAIQQEIFDAQRDGRVDPTS